MKRRLLLLAVVFIIYTTAVTLAWMSVHFDRVVLAQGGGLGCVSVQISQPQDVNHNGFSEGSELSTLSQLGLREIDLNYKESKRTDEFGNRFRYRAKVKDIHGAQLGRWAWDVFLVRQH